MRLHAQRPNNYLFSAFPYLSFSEQLGSEQAPMDF